jgi:small subunit ribosomal protein S21
VVNLQKLTWKGGVVLTDNIMTQVDLLPNESPESLIRRFSKEIQKEGILTELKGRQYYEKPSERRKNLKNMRSRRFRIEE